MLDFGGWLDNWDWRCDLNDAPPRWLLVSAIALGSAGALAVAALWLTLDIGPSAWMLLPLLGIALDVFGVAIFEIKNAPIAYGHALFLGGVLALLGLNFSDPGAGRAFVVIAPCIAIGSGPFLLRSWAATLFAHRMITYSNLQAESLRAALAGESNALVVRVEGLAENEVDLVTVGAGEAQRLRADDSTIYRRYFLSAGNHFLLEGPDLGDLESPEGYRDASRVRRVRAVKHVRWLGKTPEGLPPSTYADEVRAGAVMMIAHHAVVAGASLFLAAMSV